MVSQPSIVIWGIGLCALLCFGLTAAVPHRRHLRAPRRTLAQTYVAAYRAVRRGRMVRAAAMYNVMLSVLFIATNSFAALLVAEAGDAHQLAVSLLVRDTLSVVLAFAFGTIVARLGWRACFIVGMVAGSAAMGVGAIAPPESPWFIVVFCAAGISIGFGIAGANLAVTLTTSAADRAISLVAAGMVGRFASLVLPPALALAYAEASGIGVFAVAAAVAIPATIYAGLLLAGPATSAAAAAETT